MYFTKDFDIILSNLYLAYFVPQRNLYMICCSCKTELSPEKFSSNRAMPKIIKVKALGVRLHEFEPAMATESC